MDGKPRDMDYKFAIKVLGSAKVETPSVHGNPKRYGYQNQYFYDIARGMAIEALREKYESPVLAEIVRCEKCKHGRKIDINKVPEKYFKTNCIVCECEDVVGDEPMIYPPTHFCGYGTPRKEG